MELISKLRCTWCVSNKFEDLFQNKCFTSSSVNSISLYKKVRSSLSLKVNLVFRGMVTFCGDRGNGDDVPFDLVGTGVGPRVVGGLVGFDVEGGEDGE